MDAREFESVVSSVLEELPEDFAEKLTNVQVVVGSAPSAAEIEAARVPEGRSLLGLYQGVPLASRGIGYSLTLPDKITIYREPIELASRAERLPVAEMIRRVVLHEIAHHFGISDSRLRELGY